MYTHGNGVPVHIFLATAEVAVYSHIPESKHCHIYGNYPSRPHIWLKICIHMATFALSVWHFECPETMVHPRTCFDFSGKWVVFGHRVWQAARYVCWSLLLQTKQPKFYWGKHFSAKGGKQFYVLTILAVPVNTYMCLSAAISTVI
jgi:hypothetical protein